MKTRIHVSLSVSDIERSTEFYSLLFGAQPTKLRDDYANFRLDEPGLHLALVKAPVHAGGNSKARHFGVELFENVDLNDWRNRLEKAGASLKVEEQVTCCYAVGNKFWAQDPDGNDWEFWVRSAEADAMKEGAEAVGPNAQCCSPAEAPAKAGTPQQAEVAAKAAGTKDESPCCTPDTAGQSGCC